MKLLKKKKCCEGKLTNSSMQEALEKQSQGARIKVLGSGCQKCEMLENHVKAALKQLGRVETIEHVTDFTEIASYGVMSTPAIVIDGKVVSFGKVLSQNEIIELFDKVGF